MLSTLDGPIITIGKCGARMNLEINLRMVMVSIYKQSKEPDTQQKRKVSINNCRAIFNKILILVLKMFTGLRYHNVPECIFLPLSLTIIHSEVFNEGSII